MLRHYLKQLLVIDILKARPDMQLVAVDLLHVSKNE